jgi:hypothetical protein
MSFGVFRLDAGCFGKPFISSLMVKAIRANAATGRYKRALFIYFY